MIFQIKNTFKKNTWKFSIAPPNPYHPSPFVYIHRHILESGLELLFFFKKKKNLYIFVACSVVEM